MNEKKEELSVSIGERLLVPKGMHKGVSPKQTPKNLRHKNNEGTRTSHAKEASQMETMEENKTTKSSRRHQELAFSTETSTLEEVGHNVALGAAVGFGFVSGGLAAYGIAMGVSAGVKWIFGAAPAVED